MQQGQTEPAIAGFEKLLSLATAGRLGLSTELQAQAFNNLGVLYFGKGFYEDAARGRSTAIAVAPSNARAWANLGLARQRLGTGDRGLDAFRHAYELTPTDDSISGNLALSYIDAQRWQDAQSLLARATQQSPQSASLWLYLGLANRGLGDTAAAVSAFRQVLTLDPTNRSGQADRAAVYLALLYHENGDATEAIAAAEQALAWKPGDIEALTYLASASRHSATTLPPASHWSEPSPWLPIGPTCSTIWRPSMSICDWTIWPRRRCARR